MEELYLKRFSDFANPTEVMDGDKIKIGDVLNKEIKVFSYKIGDSKYEGKKLLTLQIEVDGENRIIFTSGIVLIDQCEKYADNMPFLTTIKKISDRFYSFT